MITFVTLRQISPALRGVLRGTVMVGSSLRSAQWHQKLACIGMYSPRKTHGWHLKMAYYCNKWRRLYCLKTTWKQNPGSLRRLYCLVICGFKYFLIFNPKIGGRFPFWPAYFSKGLKPPTSLLFVINGVISPLSMTLQMANWGLFHPLQVELWAPTHNCFFGGPTWYIGKNPSFCGFFAP